MTRLLACVCAALALAATAGCTTGGDGDPERSAARAEVKRVASLFTERDPGICREASDAFLKRYFDSSRGECRKSAEDGKPLTADLDRIELEGGRATVTLEDRQEDIELTVLRRGGQWLVDEVQRSPRDRGDADGRAAVEGVVDAFVKAAEEDDEDVLCGLLAERFAQRIVGVRSEGVVGCARALRGEKLGRLSKRFAGSEIARVVVEGSDAKVRLENGVRMDLAKEDGRFVISKVAARR